MCLRSGDLTLGLEHDAVAPARDAQGNEHVVENRVVGDRLEELPADGIDGAGRSRSRCGPALVPPDELLVAPVEIRRRRRPESRRRSVEPSEPMTISARSRG